LAPALFDAGARGQPTASKPAKRSEEETDMAQPEFIQAQKALGGVSYPATKEQLIEHARGKNAGTDILDALQAITDREYDGPNEVSKAVAK
jgi:hypothetical protein